MDKRDVARALRELGSLLEVEGESAFKVRAYRVAADRIAALAEPLEEIRAQGRLREIPGVGAAIASKIESLLATGQIPLLERLRLRYPQGTLELLRLPGVGRIKVRQLLDSGILSMEALEKAARDGSLARIRGFGPKVREELLRSIEARRSHGERIPLAQALPLAERMLSRLDEDPAISRASLAGELRRWEESVERLEFLAATTDPEATLDWFASDPEVEQVREVGLESCSLLLDQGAEAILHATPPEAWSPALLLHTGPAEYAAFLQQRAEASGMELAETGFFRGDGIRLDPPDEAAIHAALQMQDLPPELRHEPAAWDAAARFALPRLLAPGDIRGLTHCHTDWSDGTATILEMARTAQQLGMEWITITDHSQSASYAGGLTPDRLRRQWDEIAAAREALPGIRILRGSEVDILPDGSLDFPDPLLEQLDVVIGSIHQRHGLDQAGQTRRLVRALSHPLLSWIGHPTGRLVGSRDPIPLRMEEVFEAAAACGKALEVNGSPRRLDLSGIHVRSALRAGVRLVVSVDAHSPAGVEALRWAVATARRGGATPGMSSTPSPPTPSSPPCARAGGRERGRRLWIDRSRKAAHASRTRRCGFSRTADSRGRGGRTMYGNWARAASAVLGVWLFLSIFLFPHTPQQFTNTWLCGLLAIAFSVMAFFVPKMRYALVVLGAWVFFTAFAIPAGSGEVIWNNAVVGALLFAFGLARSRTAHPGPFSHHRRMPV